MSLSALLDLSSDHDNLKVGLSEERIQAVLPDLRIAFGFFREYPDILIDFMKGENSKFNLYFYQRVFLRAVMRHKFSYATFPRAYSKSFLSVMVLILRCILYPNAQLFITTGGKEQAASIAKAKVEEICAMLPPIKNEIDFTRGKSVASKDMVRYVFKNGSTLDIMAARQSSRGQRRTGGLMEEVILIDGTLLNEVIIPTMNVDRLIPDGTRQESENINKSQIYITTAGWKNSFAYSKLIEILISSVVDPGSSIAFGGTWRVPVMEKLLSSDFLEQLRLGGTYNDSSFAREYESKWSGDAENAYFSSEMFDKCRKTLQPESEFSNKSGKKAYYILGIDVGRKGCTTEVMVFKVSPQVQGIAIKTLVAIYTLDESHFEDQAIEIKKIFFRYKCRGCAIDANGLGIGLVDYMVKNQVDKTSGEEYAPFGVMNDDEGFYRQYRTDDMERDAMFLIKANAKINTEAHANVQTQFSSGKIRLLIDEREAKVKLMSTKMGQEMTPEQRAQKLMPYTLTSILRDQMLNLTEENEGVNIILKQSSKGIKKDKFSAFEYGLYYIKQEEDKNKRRKGKRSIKGMMLFSK